MTREEALDYIKSIKDLYDCSYEEDALEMAIKALRHEPCEDCISRQAAIDTYKNLRLPIYPLEELPPVKPEQKKGRWIKIDDCSNSGYYCSECHKRVVKEGWSDTVKIIKYCPNCGAKMVETQESEDKE